MNKKDLELLGNAFMSEIDGAIKGLPRLYQTRAKKRADALVDKGLLEQCVEYYKGVKLKGYELTHAGRFVYCSSCKGEE